MDTTRLRKAFRSTSDEDEDDDLDEPLDEEHQERLIAELQAKDEQRNALYRKAFVALPIAAAVFFLYSFVVASTARQRLVALLSISSLLSTAYLLHFMPIEAPQRKGKRPIYQIEAEKGPVERYLAYMNAALAGLLLIVALLSWRNGDGQAAWREALPESMWSDMLDIVPFLILVVVIFCISMFVRDQLAPVDLEELQKAKYEYKGA